MILGLFHLNINGILTPSSRKSRICKIPTSNFQISADCGPQVGGFITISNPKFWIFSQVLDILRSHTPEFQTGFYYACYVTAELQNVEQYWALIVMSTVHGVNNVFSQQYWSNGHLTFYLCFCDSSACCVILFCKLPRSWLKWGR